MKGGFKYNPNASAFVPTFTPGPPAAAKPAPVQTPASTPTPTPEPTPAPAPTSTPAPASSSPVPQHAQAPAPQVAENVPQQPQEPKQPTENLSGSGEDKERENQVPANKEKETQAPPETRLSLEEEGDDTITEEELKAELQKVAEEEDNREHLNLVFIGHVDAGKSTISGNLLYLTGQVDKRTIEKYEREAKEKNRGTWYLAYIMDTNEEERAKGKTVEVGRAYFCTEKKRYTILDAPGHKNYVPNMIGGAAQADVGVLIISAKSGEFESGFEKNGQTREHAMLAWTLGIRQLVVVINKMDEPSVKWSKERYDGIIEKLTPFLKACRYNVQKDVIYLPISGYTGANVQNPIPPEECSWYQGKTLLQTLDDLKPPERNEAGPVRFPVVDKYKDRGLANILGKLESGTITKDMNVVLMPNKVQCKVVNLFIEEKEVRKARPGENLRIAISNVDDADISAGAVLSDTVVPVRCATDFVAQLVILELNPSSPLFTAGYEAVLHIHSCVREVVVQDLLEEIDKKTRKVAKKNPKFVKNGAVVNVRITSAQPICCELFDEFQQLGRFTLRDKGKTIAVGRIIKFPGATPAAK